MINFRYHVVSLTAVFLALAIGLVLGTAALNGPVADKLSNQVASLSKRNGQLREEAKQLQNQVDSQADFVVEAAPMLLSGRLTGRSVLVVTTDNADDKHRDAVVQALEQAGATITGKVRVDSYFIDPKQDESLQDLATRLVPAGVTLPNNGVGVETASALLATALVSGGPSVSADRRTAILSGFARLNAITVQGTVTRAADAVVVVAGQAATEEDADRRNDAQLVILRQLDRVAKHMVLAGPQASGAGSPIASIRGDDTLSNQIATVDNVSSPEGQVVVPLVLAQQYLGKTDHYGSGDGASGRVPDLLKTK